MQEQQLNLWENNSDSISVEDLKDAVTKLRNLRTDYDEKKKAASDAHAIYKDQEMNVLHMLDTLHLDSFKLTGVCNVILKKKLTVKVPSGADQKEPFFKWLKDTYGEDGVLTYLGIQSQTLNKLYNDLYEEASDKSTFNIPGISDPTEMKTISLVKA